VIAVVDPQPAAAAVRAGLGDVGAQLVDHEPHAAGGDPRDPLPRLRVRRAVVVGTEEGVDELGRRRDYADTLLGSLAAEQKRVKFGIPGWLSCGAAVSPGARARYIQE
jgi:hypothetical protein